MFSEKNLWILVQILGLFLLFSSRWIPSPYNLIIGVILIFWGGKKYREAGKTKQPEQKKN
jgi:hypothetical protein